MIPRYKTIDVVGIRTPAFPASILAELYGSTSLAENLKDLMREQPVIRAVVGVASPSLADAVDKWLTGEAADQERIAAAVLAYVARSTMRATPFGLCGTVGLSHFADEAELISIVAGAEFRPRSRPDAGWLHALSLKIEESEAFLRLRVVNAGTAYRMHGRLNVCDAARTQAVEKDGKAARVASIPSSLNLTRSVSAAMEAAREPIVVQELVDALARDRRMTDEAALNLIRRLVALGVLITELRVSPTADPTTPFLGALPQADPKAAREFEEVTRTLRQADASGLAGIGEGLRDAAGLAERLVSSEHYYVVDCAREYQGALPTDVSRQVEAVFARLARLATPVPANKIIADAFTRRYNAGREVPLLRVLDSEEGLAFEDLLDDGLRVERDRHDARMLRTAMEAVADRRDEIELQGLGVEDLNPQDPTYGFASSYEGFCYLMRSAAGELTAWIEEGFIECAGRSLARFSDVLGEQIVLDLLRSGAAHTDAIDAEVSYLPHWRRAANVAIRPNPFDYEIIHGVMSSVPDGRAITLDDIVVGSDGERIYLRSVRLNERIEPHSSHLLEAARSSRIAKFLDILGSSDYPFVGFRWGQSASALPYRPRVVSEGIVVSVASWSVPNAVALDLDGEAAKAWLRRWRVPRYVYLTRFDHRLLLDLEHTLCRRLIQAAAKRQRRDEKVIRLEEPIPFFSDACVSGEGGRYVAELAVSLKRKDLPMRDEPQPQRVPHEVVSAKDYLRAPGSDWVYAKCYIGTTRAAYFLETEVARIVAELEGSFGEMHFLRYYDPESHVRLRFRSTSGEYNERLLTRTVEILRSLVEDGKLDRVEFATYDREIERYGGLHAIALAEKFFTVDSRYILSKLRGFRLAADKVRFAVTDLVGAVLAMFATPADAVAWGRREIGRHGRLSADNWRAVRAATALVGDDWPEYRQHRDAAARLLQEAAEEQRDAVIGSLLHMHCNRLGIMGESERETLACAIAAIEGFQRAGVPHARRKAKIRD